MTQKLKYAHLTPWACWTSTRALSGRSRKCPSYPSLCQPPHILVAYPPMSLFNPLAWLQNPLWYINYSLHPSLPSPPLSLMLLEALAQCSTPPSPPPTGPPTPLLPPSPSPLPSPPHLSIKHHLPFLPFQPFSYFFLIKILPHCIDLPMFLAVKLACPSNIISIFLANLCKPKSSA